MIYIDEAKAGRNTKMEGTWEMGCNDNILKKSNSIVI
jgi:hypothetical protein